MDKIYEPIILYDDHCPLCHHLGQRIAEHLPLGWHIQSWQSYAQKHDLPKKADKLRVVVESELLEDQEAWEFLFMNIPKLSSYTKVASRLGLQKQSIHIVRNSARLFRYLCRRCNRI